MWFNVGCDSCGLFPIRGRRYKCAQCPSKNRYDLCEVYAKAFIFQITRFSKKFCNSIVTLKWKANLNTDESSR